MPRYLITECTYIHASMYILLFYFLSQISIKKTKQNNILNYNVLSRIKSKQQQPIHPRGKSGSGI